MIREGSIVVLKKGLLPCYPAYIGKLRVFMHNGNLVVPRPTEKAEYALKYHMFLYLDNRFKLFNVARKETVKFKLP
jgi:hypothetical protein